MQYNFIFFQCNFRYDFELHDLIHVVWLFDNGNKIIPLNLNTGIFLINKTIFEIIKINCFYPPKTRELSMRIRYD